MRRATRTAGLMAGLITAALLALPLAQAGTTGSALAAEEGYGNNLSVPTYFVPGPTGAPALRTPCPVAEATVPTGDPVVYDGVNYWLQKTASVWSAECAALPSASVTAVWGSNLLNDMNLRAGKPIRVEMALDHTDVGTGYQITNLTPEVPDRLATYGTDGVQTEMPYMVWAAGANLMIAQEGGATIYNGPFAAEINSTGKVVYGYNWGTGQNPKPQPGTYVLTFSVPTTVTISGVDDENLTNTSFTDQTAVVTIKVAKPGGRK